MAILGARRGRLEGRSSASQVRRLACLQRCCCCGLRPSLVTRLRVPAPGACSREGREYSILKFQTRPGPSLPTLVLRSARAHGRAGARADVSFVLTIPKSVFDVRESWLRYPL